VRFTAQNISRWSFWLSFLLGVLKAAFGPEETDLAGNLLWKGADLVIAVGFWAPVWYNWSRRRAEGDDRALFLLEFADLLKMDFTEQEALEQLAQVRKKKFTHRFSSFSPVASEVAERLANGDSLAQAFQNTKGVPAYWKEFLVFCQDRETLINLLTDLAEGERTQLRLPFLSILRFQFLLVMLLGTAFFLGTYILPTFVELFKGMNLALPWGTRVIVVLHSNPLILGGLFISAFCASLAFLAIPFLWIRKILWYVAYCLPGFRSIIKLIHQDRILRIVAAGLRAGAPQNTALLAASQACTIGPYRRQLKTAASKVDTHLSRLLAPYEHLYTSETVWLIRQGEQFENLPASLEGGAEVASGKLKGSMEKLISSLDVLLLLGMGCLVLFVLVNTLLPLYTIIEAVYQ